MKRIASLVTATLMLLAVLATPALAGDSDGGGGGSPPGGGGGCPGCFILP